MRRRPCFTLIEVLVVVAIIALLIAVLLVSLSAAREQGRRAKCQANLHTLALAANLYVHDHDYYPEVHDIHAAATRYAGTVCWDFRNRPDNVIISDRPDRPLNKYLHIRPVWWTDTETPPVPEIDVAVRCPSDRADYRSSGNSYVYNYSHFGAGDYRLGWYSLRRARMEHVKNNLSRVVLAGDRPMGWSISYLAGYPLVGAAYWGPHQPGTPWGNAGFLDGHAEWILWGNSAETVLGRGHWTLDIRAGDLRDLPW